MEKFSKKSVLGLLIFIAAEVMFFAGLLSSYWVLRAQVPSWPPLGQPRYPVLLTAFNTLVLLASGWAVWLAAKSQNRRALLRYLGLAVLGGFSFLLLQGYEWFQLLGFGMKATANIYGGIFYLIVGTHAFHAAVGLLILGYVLWKVFQKTNVAFCSTPVALGSIYWGFVVLLWPVIYVALYLV